MDRKSTPKNHGADGSAIAVSTPNASPTLPTSMKMIDQVARHATEATMTPRENTRNIQVAVDSGTEWSKLKETRAAAARYPSAVAPARHRTTGSGANIAATVRAGNSAKAAIEATATQPPR